MSKAKINSSPFAKASGDSPLRLKERRRANVKFPNSKYLIYNVAAIVYLWSSVIIISGCAGIKEGVKEFAGVSTRVLEKGRGRAITRTFNYDFFSCYTQAEDILKKLGAYIYAKDLKKQMIAVYVSENDTTPVGLFFKEVDRNTTQVEVSSPSSYAKEMIAEKVFSKLDKLLIAGEALDKTQE